LTSDATIPDGSPADVDSAPDSAADAALGTVVINEIRASGDDWIELSNPGSGSFVLDGYGVTQANGDNGPPDLGTLLTFPAGTTLPAGAYLLIVGKQPSITGPTTDCRGLASSCFNVDWGVSASGGEIVYLLSPPHAVLEQIPYPMTPGPNAPPAGFSYGRIPDGTGSFTSTLSTPGAPNRQ
jgi:hypothetical protein